jgi:hypothetical protein
MSSRLVKASSHSDIVIDVEVVEKGAGGSKAPLVIAASSPGLPSSSLAERSYFPSLHLASSLTISNTSLCNNTADNFVGVYTDGGGNSFC